MYFRLTLGVVIREATSISGDTQLQNIVAVHSCKTVIFDKEEQSDKCKLMPTYIITVTFFQFSIKTEGANHFEVNIAG